MGRPRGAKDVPWARLVAQLREQPGRWMLLPEMCFVPARTIQVLRRRERRALRMDDGTINYRRRSTVWLDDGTVRCDIVLRFNPKPSPKETL